MFSLFPHALTSRLAPNADGAGGGALLLVRRHRVALQVAVYAPVLHERPEWVSDKRKVEEGNVPKSQAEVTIGAARRIKPQVGTNVAYKNAETS